MWRFLFGLFMGAGVTRLVMGLQTQDIVVKWYVWLVGAVAFFLATLTLQHFFASLEESEPKAARMGLLVMGIPCLILGGLTLWFTFTP